MYSIIKKLPIFMVLCLGMGTIAPMHEDFDIVINDGNCDLMVRIHYMHQLNMFQLIKKTFQAKEPLFKSLLNIYKNLSTKDMTELREYWKSDDFYSGLRHQENIKLIVHYAHQLRKDYQDYDIICCVGQSRAYELLTAQILAAVYGENTEKYKMIAFSGRFIIENSKHYNNRSHDNKYPNKDQISKYQQYLESMGLINKNNNKIVICELVESGSGITSFMILLHNIYRDLLSQQKIVKTPEFRFNFHIFGPTYFGQDNDTRIKEKQTSVVQKSDCRIFDDNIAEKPIFKNMPNILWELTATQHANLRLVDGYAPSDNVWETKDPLNFIPATDAIVHMLCIIDYIHQHLDEYKLPQRQLISKL